MSSVIRDIKTKSSFNRKIIDFLNEPVWVLNSNFHKVYRWAVRQLCIIFFFLRIFVKKKIEYFWENIVK